VPEYSNWQEKPLGALEQFVSENLWDRRLLGPDQSVKVELTKEASGLHTANGWHEVLHHDSGSSREFLRKR